MSDENEKKDGGESGQGAELEKAAGKETTGEQQEGTEPKTGSESEGQVNGEAPSTEEGETKTDGEAAAAGDSGAGTAGAEAESKPTNPTRHKHTLDAQQTARVLELGHAVGGELFWVIDGFNYRCTFLEISEVLGKPQAILEVQEKV